MDEVLNHAWGAGSSVQQELHKRQMAEVIRLYNAVKDHIDDVATNFLGNHRSVLFWVRQWRRRAARSASHCAAGDLDVDEGMGIAGEGSMVRTPMGSVSGELDEGEVGVCEGEEERGEGHGEEEEGEHGREEEEDGEEGQGEAGEGEEGAGSEGEGMDDRELGKAVEGAGEVAAREEAEDQGKEAAKGSKFEQAFGALSGQ